MLQIIRKAFTLIELLVVIAIIGILSGLIVVSMGGVTNKATIAKAQVFSNSLRNSLMANIVGEWKFDELTTAIDGTIIQDSWGGVNNGILDTNSVAADSTDKIKSGTDCISDKCLYFDAIDDYINCGSNNLNNIEKVTISAWINRNNHDIYREIITTGRFGSAYGYGLMFHSNSNLIAYITKNSDGTQLTSYPGISGFDDNVWYYIVMTFDGTNIKVYKNGEIKWTSATISSDSIKTSSYPLYIGKASAPGSASFFSGFIDDVRIYSTAISASQIQEQYYAGLNSLLASGQITKQEYQNRLVGKK
jgi:prepilin-type N-terminal cleavage/methylation domain-containing protein